MVEKQRNPASEALVKLRDAMHKTQQTFAVEVMKTSIGTIARWETSDPPKGEVLLRLREIARQHGQDDLAEQFQNVWLENVKKELGRVRAIIVAEGSGLLVASLNDNADTRLAQACLDALSMLGSGDKSERDAAVAAVLAFEKAVRASDDPSVREREDFKLQVFLRRGMTATLNLDDSAEATARESETSRSVHGKKRR